MDWESDCDFFCSSHKDKKKQKHFTKGIDVLKSVAGSTVDNPVIWISEPLPDVFSFSSSSSDDRYGASKTLKQKENLRKKIMKKIKLHLN